MTLQMKDGAFSYTSTGKTVFEDIHLQVEKGQILCILGPNGVGKTSLLKCLSGLHRLTEGIVYCKGRDLETLRRGQVAKIIAHVPQMHAPVFAYSVFDTVLMGRTPYLGFFSFPSAKDEQIARNAIESLGIAHLADTPYTEISGGERQLVLFARVLAQEPEVIVLDEPTSHLDYGNQLKMLSLIHQLAGKGSAVVMTSHNPDHAFMVADRVGIMFDRRIEECGTPMEVITEELLLKIYGVQVHLRDDSEYGKICVPALKKDEGAAVSFIPLPASENECRL